jgi:hypothetical protein
MIIKKYQINIDLPSIPKGTIIYHEFEELPSRFKRGDTYTTEGKYYFLNNIVSKVPEKVHVWPWIAGLIQTCEQMSKFDETARTLVTFLGINEN